MYFCKDCNQLDEQGISGHHTRCHVVANSKKVVANSKKVVANNVEKVVAQVAAPETSLGSSVPVRKPRTKDRHTDKEARLVYARNLMRKRRADAKPKHDPTT